MDTKIPEEERILEVLYYRDNLKNFQAAEALEKTRLKAKDKKRIDWANGVCTEFNTLRQENSYLDTVAILADKHFYNRGYMQKVIREAFKKSTVEWGVNKHYGKKKSTF